MSTTVLDHVGPAARRSGVPARGARTRTRRNPAWMLTLLVAGYPVFWVLGLSQFAMTIMAVPMLGVLLLRRPIRLPRGFAVWAVFLVWSAMGILLLGVDPPGYVPSSAASRLFGFGMRELSYLSTTVLLLFIGNLDEDELPRDRILRLGGWFFVVVVAGGVLGLLAPTFSFTSLFEMVLPRSISEQFYVQNLVHPRAAQLQAVLGDRTPRPAAPFAYTNDWAFHLTLLGVFFVATWRYARGVLASLAWLLVLVAGAVTLVYSLNRAAWLGVAVGVCFVGVRLALRGRFALVGALALAVAIGLGTVVTTPLGTVVEQRLAAGRSDTIREFTARKAFELSARSPLVGFGSTRATYGSAASIAVGKSRECPQCGNASIGMNGFLYRLLVTTGYVGAALFFAFGVVMWWHARSRRTVMVSAATTVLVMTALFSLFYDVSTGMLVPTLALGLLWRESRASSHRPGSPGSSPADLGRSRTMTRPERTPPPLLLPDVRERPRP
ncbi:O-antigen ligase family protein [Phycicoccus sp. CSK15P-2]|uniref:O-antigen ligase family protein n=1 Tax=Phycicoccus sp. CSK15P-2 TaxID=2807627 RepID=UPI00194DCD4F|nr:O-antigen ligase family protein [Phycicoccus sp. CSK15P-2]MBM6402706.1 O-antigen ligase family protein [Phycicoccus sp. CSK15P-2]